MVAPTWSCVPSRWHGGTAWVVGAPVGLMLSEKKMFWSCRQLIYIHPRGRAFLKTWECRRGLSSSKMLLIRCSLDTKSYRSSSASRMLDVFAWMDSLLCCKCTNKSFLKTSGNLLSGNNCKKSKWNWLESNYCTRAKYTDRLRGSEHRE
jgi:hypothetical protein